MQHNPPNNGYQEIERLRRRLIDACLPHECRPMYDGMQILYTMGKRKFIICSVIECCESIGHEEDRLELRGLLTKDELRNGGSAGGLTADEVFARIKAHAESKRRMQ
ncbi:MAG: hypothetical protein IJ313_01310 [Clostridia bacterium]|nr:hypothetical protein [Clostridia bacterium]